MASTISSAAATCRPSRRPGLEGRARSRGLVAAAVGRRRQPVDRRGRGQWLGWLAAADGRGASTSPRWRPSRPRWPRRWLHPRPAARHGRLQPGPRGDRRDLRRSGRRIRSCWCWTPPIRTRSPASRPRSIRREHPVHRLQQVGLDPGAGHPARPTSWSAPSGAVGANAAGGHFVAVTDPGSKLEQERDRATASARSSMAIRPSAGAIRCCRISAWCRPRCMGLDVRALPRRQRKTMARACGASVPPAANPGVKLGAGPGRGGQGRARQGDLHRLPRPRPTWAPGWNSCWRNPPASRARASSRSTPSRWATPGSMAATGCSSICASTATTIRPATTSVRGPGRGRPSGGPHHAGQPRHARPGIRPLGDRRPPSPAR